MSISAIQLKDIRIDLGNKIILNHVNVDIEQGKFVAVLGPNGAGKSTLLKAILGLVSPVHGSVQVLGEKPKSGNQNIGYAPQHRVLESDLGLRARDVVGFGYDGNRWGIGVPNRKREKIINEMLSEVDAKQLGNLPIGKLSGGEQQRLLVAQALITNPKILLLDEPLSNLDINHAQEIVSLVASLTKSRAMTTLFVAHDINPLLGVVDSVLYIANTKAIMGSVDQVITKKSLSLLYDTPVEVVHALDRIFVVGAET